MTIRNANHSDASLFLGDASSYREKKTLCRRCRKPAVKSGFLRGRQMYYCRRCNCKFLPKRLWSKKPKKSANKPKKKKKQSNLIREIDAVTVLHLLRSPIATLCPDADNSGTNGERVTHIVDAPEAVTLDLYREMARGGAVVVVEEHGLVYVSLKG